MHVSVLYRVSRDGCWRKAFSSPKLCDRHHFARELSSFQLNTLLQRNFSAPCRHCPPQRWISGNICCLQKIQAKGGVSKPDNSSIGHQASFTSESSRLAALCVLMHVTFMCVTVSGGCWQSLWLHPSVILTSYEHQHWVGFA